MEASVTSCFRGIDTHIVHLRLSPRSMLYQKQCEIALPTRMTPGPDPGRFRPGQCERGFSHC
ncbi:UNVERIFIED_CONTAM: hypothetical protein FKN15_016746 [Acipenser sinensis]